MPPELLPELDPLLPLLLDPELDPLELPLLPPLLDAELDPLEPPLLPPLDPPLLPPLDPPLPDPELELPPSSPVPASLPTEGRPLLHPAAVTMAAAASQRGRVSLFIVVMFVVFIMEVHRAVKGAPPPPVCVTKGVRHIVDAPAMVGECEVRSSTTPLTREAPPPSRVA
jgi:hypothetical protein